MLAKRTTAPKDSSSTASLGFKAMVNGKAGSANVEVETSRPFGIFPADIGKGHADTFHSVQHPDLRADSVIATALRDSASNPAKPYAADRKRPTTTLAELNAELATTVAKITRLRADIDAIVAEIEGEEVGA